MVSIIVPIYNAGRYLPDCLISITKQSYKDLEIILVNDGSTDDSPWICRNAAEMDSRIRFVNEKHRGLAAAKNAGLTVANGEFILFLEANDCIRPDMVAMLVRMIGYNDMVMCRYCLTDNLEIFRNSPNFEKGKWNMRDFWHAYYNGASEACAAVWNKMYRSELLKEYRFPVGRRHEEEYLLTRIMQGSRTIALCNEIMYYRRIALIPPENNMDFPDAMINRIFHFEEQKKFKLARKTILFALKDLQERSYPAQTKQIMQKRIFRLGRDIRHNPLLFTIKLYYARYHRQKTKRRRNR